MTRPEETPLAWPARLKRDDEGRVQVRFPDFPEALTDAADEHEALAEAADSLAEAVAARIADGEDIPAPARWRPGMHTVPLPPVLAYKAALFSAMRREGISKSDLARCLGVDEKEVRRLVDPRYRGSKVERLHAALEACGVVAQISVVNRAPDRRLFAPIARPGRRTTKPAARVATRRVG
jgi:antitoxin HicB